MSQKYDLSFVPPERHAEVLRRIAAVRRFLETPGRKAATAAADELGLGVAQFYNLARAWRELGRPEALAGSGAPRRKRQHSIDPAVSRLMDGVIAAHPRLDPAKLVNEVVARIREAGLPPPGPQVITSYVFRARPALLGAEHRDGPGIVVDHAVLELPVLFGEGPATRPLATFVVDTRAEEVVGLALSNGIPSPAATAAALSDVLKHGLRDAPAVVGRAGAGIAIPNSATGDWSALELALRRAGIAVERPVVTPHKAGRLVTALLGLAPNGIVLRPRMVQMYLERRGRRPPTSPAPLDPAAATAFARARLLTDRANCAFADLDPARRRSLHSDLIAIARAQPGD